jgi:hypothetical protein
MPQLSFEGRLESDQGAHFIPVPSEVLRRLGQAKRTPLKVTINTHTFQTTIASYQGRSYLAMGPPVLSACGVGAGEQLTVSLEYDPELRIENLPDDLLAALQERPGAVAAFEALSYTYKRELVAWVTEAKQPDTRRRRITQGLRMLGRDRSKRV